ncbi:hypothetical protein KGQ20_42160 [Catenulispora sp. NF23]|uniref:Uncharacterized protein n=1 Tax=Catenulispora pinistramenti TaxID=2705254 RepID=A0ABS5L747_9ACTN|nr:hypothetical protein [Catenulispora pinistramenti]MBS2539368.1 hypothetical protein [Catenulispora pinistramenti]MBS2554165.1 hypothetical protein [Catenulispora pinistramenti]
MPQPTLTEFAFTAGDYGPDHIAAAGVEADLRDGIATTCTKHCVSAVIGAIGARFEDTGHGDIGEMVPV